MIERVAIIGTGLIGSSLGLGLKELSQIKEVVGIDKDSRHLQEAEDIGAIDRPAELKSGVQGMDLVVLAVPVGVICDLAAKIEPYLDSDTVVTDVGSTKTEVVTKLENKFQDSIYIGGHPMAGSEIAGPAGADKYLFENAIYVLTKTKSTDQTTLDKIQEMIEELGAQVLILTPEQHDQIIAVTSHLPHVVAVSLMGVMADYAEADDLITSLTAGGFRDTTRIAAGNPLMWKDIFLNNKEQVLTAIDTFTNNLEELQELIKNEQAGKLKEKLADIKAARDQLPMQKKGLLPTNYELILTLSDQPNAIGRLGTLLGEAGINIQDIEVLKVREEVGSIRLSFSQEEEQKAAYKLLQENNYQVIRRD